jgi:hypothetical protein
MADEMQGKVACVGDMKDAHGRETSKEGTTWDTQPRMGG